MVENGTCCDKGDNKNNQPMSSACEPDWRAMEGTHCLSVLTSFSARSGIRGKNTSTTQLFRPLTSVRLVGQSPSVTGNRTNDVGWSRNDQNVHTILSARFFWLFCQWLGLQAIFFYFFNFQFELRGVQPYWFAFHQWRSLAHDCCFFFFFFFFFGLSLRS